MSEHESQIVALLTEIRNLMYLILEAMERDPLAEQIKARSDAEKAFVLKHKLGLDDMPEVGGE